MNEDMSIKDAITTLILTERRRQVEKWGKERDEKLTREQWASILGEEFGEVCEAINDGDANGYFNETVQVAAVAFAMLESAVKISRGNDFQHDSLEVLHDYGEPCKHPGCSNHLSHPCEGCGRIGARGKVYKIHIE